MHRLLLLSTFLFVFATPAFSTPLSRHPYRLVKEIPIGGLERWDYLAIDQKHRRLFIAHSTQVEVMDLDRDSLLQPITGTDGAHGVAFVETAGHGFISCGKSNSVLMFDLKSLATIKTIPVGTKPDAIIFDPASQHVFVMNGKSNDISVIDPVAGDVVATVKLGGAPEFAVADGAGNIFVNLEDRSVVVKIDSKMNHFTATWSVSPGKEPTGIAMNKAASILFIACPNGKLVTINARNGRVVDILGTGTGADAVVFDSTLGFVISSNGDGTATVIESLDDEWRQTAVLDNILTPKGARTMAFDSQTHALYFVALHEDLLVKPSVSSPPINPIAANTFVVLKYEHVEEK
ncbi:MAG: YncE family protein [bacterium]